MQMRLFRPWRAAGWLYPEAIFRIKTDKKLVCLTFDDGPCPDSTPQLMEILYRYNIKGLFFCDGRAAKNLPELIRMIESGGHTIGNHGFMHPDGWATSKEDYLGDIAMAGEIIHSGLFRPPYGRMKVSQYKELKRLYTIVLWDLMPYDFDMDFGSYRSLEILKNKMRPGSIIVLHDKPSSCAKDILPDFIDYAIQQGYEFSDPAF